MTSNELLTVGDLAREAQVPPATIYTWNSKGTGPRYVRIGKHIRYRRDDVDRWLASRYARSGAA